MDLAPQYVLPVHPIKTEMINTTPGIPPINGRIIVGV
jgi:hypothetical protein